jgi:hypothetical protein
VNELSSQFAAGLTPLLVASIMRDNFFHSSCPSVCKGSAVLVSKISCQDQNSWFRGRQMTAGHWAPMGRGEKGVPNGRPWAS